MYNFCGSINKNLNEYACLWLYKHKTLCTIIHTGCYIGYPGIMIERGQGLKEKN